MTETNTTNVSGTGAVAHATGPVSAREYRARRKQGKPWRTPDGDVVMVRELDLSDHVTINQLPAELRQMVYDAVERSQLVGKGEMSAEDASDDLFAGLHGEERVKRLYEISVSLIKLGWVRPRVVDDAELGQYSDDDDVVGVSEVEPSHRIAFMARVFNGYRAEAEALSDFRQRQSASVAAGQSVPAVSHDAEPTPETDAAGILRSDGV